jgi:hypothetical protein
VSSKLVTLITLRYGPRRKHSSSVVVEVVFTTRPHSNGRGSDYRKHSSSIVLDSCVLRKLPNNGRYLHSQRLATALYATISYLSLLKMQVRCGNCRIQERRLIRTLGQ